VGSLKQAIEGSELKSSWPQIKQFIDEANKHSASSISLVSLEEDFDGENFEDTLGGPEKNKVF
jgi:hypothetical protein